MYSHLAGELRIVAQLFRDSGVIFCFAERGPLMSKEDRAERRDRIGMMSPSWQLHPNVAYLFSSVLSRLMISVHYFWNQLNSIDS